MRAVWGSASSIVVVVAAMACSYPRYEFVSDDAAPPTPAGDSAMVVDGDVGLDDSVAHDGDLLFEADPPEDSADAADAAITPDAIAEADAIVDTAPVSSATCAAIKATCPSAKPWCTLKVVSGGKWANTCDAVAGSKPLYSPCDPTVGGCADGLNCAVVYPLTTNFACLPLCATSADCPSKYPFCNWQLDGIPGAKQCGTCDPTRNMVPDCTSSGMSCLVPSKTARPVCDYPGSLSEGGNCGGSYTACRAGLMCVCDDGAGTSAIGPSCSTLGVSSACKKACLPYYAGTSSGCAAGQTCTLVAGSDYAYCR